MTEKDTNPASLTLVILSLALGAFAIGTSEFAAMGLLPWFAADLGLSEAEAGHVISAYAFGVVVGAPITTLLGARLPRRRYLAALIAAYGVLNLLAAVLPGYSTLVGMRFLAGLPHGGFLGVGMLYAADALPREKRAKGVTQVMLGLTVANIVGVPFAGILGDVLGWRSGFALPGVLALIAAVLILRLAPRVGVDPNAQPMEELKALGNPAVLLTLLVGMIGCGGLFAALESEKAVSAAEAEQACRLLVDALKALSSVASHRRLVEFDEFATNDFRLARALLAHERTGSVPAEAQAEVNAYLRDRRQTLESLKLQLSCREDHLGDAGVLHSLEHAFLRGAQDWSTNPGKNVVVELMAWEERFRTEMQGPAQIPTPEVVIDASMFEEVTK